MTTKITQDNIDTTTITTVGTLSSLNVSGNVTGNYLIGNGSQLTGLASSYANSNVATYLPTYSGLISGTLSTTAQPNITSVGTLTSLTVSGVLTATTSGVKTSNIQDSGGTNTISVNSGTVGIIGSLNVGTGGSGNVTATYFIGSGLSLSGTANLLNTSNVTLGNVANIHITGGTANYLLKTDGAGNLSWTAPSSGGITAQDLLSPFLLMGA